MAAGGRRRPRLRAAAVICIREDGAYLEACLRDLIRNGISYAILDNGMDAGARALLERSPFRDSLLALEHLPYNGSFELGLQIQAKERLFERLDVDWVIHLDVDEMMHAYVEGERLVDSIARVDADGFNAIDFDEFVFLPVEQPYDPGVAPQPVRTYYYFRPFEGPRLMRARKKGAGLTMAPPASEGVASGHLLFGEDVRLAPERFALRHYIFLDQDHAHRKYAERVFAETELAVGWHRNRSGFPPEAFTFPPADRLLKLPQSGSHAFDRSEPKTTHYWQWREAGSP
jgi:hypothetical protein